MFSLTCVWIDGWVNNREAGDFRRYRAHYDVTVMIAGFFTRGQLWSSGIVIACVCVCVCLYVCRSQACPHNNSLSVQALIIKFGPEVENTLAFPGFRIVKAMTFSGILFKRHYLWYVHTECVVIGLQCWILNVVSREDHSPHRKLERNCYFRECVDLCEFPLKLKPQMVLVIDKPMIYWNQLRRNKRQLVRQFPDV